MTTPGARFRRCCQQRRQRLEAGIEQRVFDAECADLCGEVRGVGFDRSEPQAQLLLFLIRSGFDGEQLRHFLGPDLVVLVQAAQNGLDVRQSDAAGEAFEQPPVVDDDPDAGHAQWCESGEGIGDGQRDLDLEVAGQFAVGDDVDIGLDEFPVAAGLGAFAAPDGLDARGFEREAQFVRVVRDVPGQGHREIEVETERVALGAFGVQAGDGEDLLVDLSVLGQLADRFDRPAVSAENPCRAKVCSRVSMMVFSITRSAGSRSGNPDRRADFAMVLLAFGSVLSVGVSGAECLLLSGSAVDMNRCGGRLCRCGSRFPRCQKNGFEANSRPTVEDGPCPG